MTTLPPLPTNSLPNISQRPTSQPAQIVSLPKALSNISQPTIVKGQVTATQPNGTTIIQTQQGDITLRLPTPLPVGTKIDLQIPTGNPPQSVTVQQSTQPQVQPAPNGPNQTPNTPTSPPTVTTPQQAASYQPVKDSLGTLNQAVQNGQNTQDQTNLINGQSVRLSPLPAALQSQTAIAGQFQKTPLPTNNHALTKLSVQHAIIGQLTTGSVAATSSNFNALLRNTLFPSNISFQVSGDKSVRPVPTSLTFPPQISASTRPITTPNNLFQAGTAQAQIPSIQAHIHMHHDVRVFQTMTPPHIIPPPIPAVSLGNMSANLSLFTLFSGQSMAIATGYITDNGSPILQLQNSGGQGQFVTLNYPARNIPAGAHIVFSPTGHMANLPTNQFQSLQTVIDELQQLLPLQQFQNLLNVIPQANTPQQFPAAALLFLAAAKGGDLSGWLGPKPIRSLGDTVNGKNTMQRLLGDITATSTGRTATPQDPPQVQSSSDWRGYTLPLVLGNDIQSMTLWAKRDDDTHNITDANKATRFFIDLNLSRMGDVHFDGLIDTDKKSLNLSFITQRSLGAPMQDMLKSIWIKTLDGLGYSGALAFKDM